MISLFTHPSAKDVFDFLSSAEHFHFICVDPSRNKKKKILKTYILYETFETLIMPLEPYELLLYFMCFLEYQTFGHHSLALCGP